MKGSGTAIARRLAKEIPYNSAMFGSSKNMLHQVQIPIIRGNWSRFYGRRVPFVPPTVNELPVPQGSWEKFNNLQNDKYNKHLALGVGTFLITLFAINKVVFFNFHPPALTGSVSMDNDLCPPVTEKKCT